MDLRDFIRDIPDFPKPGILFKDITPLLASPAAFRRSVAAMTEPYRGGKIDAVAAAEARGFLFAAPMALELGCALIPMRKPGKLPYSTLSYSYALEYGEAELHMHVDAVKPGWRVLMIDDVLATGGTMKAACRLIEKAGAVVAGCAFLIELGFLGGRARLAPAEVFSVVMY
ncbi:MAG: adenine phosphoribosyltransferase [Gemmataceae bacterium]